ncbi:MAG: VUT family protein [Burkholderiaceae bacterium]|nr:VUT family protein [Burkholderiaceae bacterium]
MQMNLSKDRTCGLLYFALFILTIPAMNWVVMNVGLSCTESGPCLIPVWFGIQAPSGVLMAGFALVLRDLVQSKLGVRWSLYAIVLGALLSAVFSDSSLIFACVLAFFFSELADLLVYTPLRKKWPAWAILASGLVGSVVDSAIFLTIAFGGTEFLFGQVLGKFWMSLIVAILVGWLHTRQRRLNRVAIQERLIR